MVRGLKFVINIATTNETGQWSSEDINLETTYKEITNTLETAKKDNSKGRFLGACQAWSSIYLVSSITALMAQKIKTRKFAWVWGPGKSNLVVTDCLYQTCLPHGRVSRQHWFKQTSGVHLEDNIVRMVFFIASPWGGYNWIVCLFACVFIWPATHNNIYSVNCGHSFKSIHSNGSFNTVTWV